MPVLRRPGPATKSGGYAGRCRATPFLVSFSELKDEYFAKVLSPISLAMSLRGKVFPPLWSDCDYHCLTGAAVLVLCAERERCRGRGRQNCEVLACGADRGKEPHVVAGGRPEHNDREPALTLTG